MKKKNKVITSPEWNYTFGSECPLNAIDDSGVGFVETSLFDHLILILNQQFDSFDGSSGSFGNAGSNTRQHEVFEKS